MRNIELSPSAKGTLTMLKPKKSKQQPLLADSGTEPSHSINYVSEKPDSAGLPGSGFHKKFNDKCCMRCTWKCACLSTTLTCTIAFIVLMLVLFLSVAPKFAQNTLNHASMDIINGSMSNVTNSTITLSTNVMLSNAGMLNGTLHSVKVAVSMDGVEFGTMTLPEMHTVANENCIIKMDVVLEITNKTHFQVLSRKSIS